jgi:hypothetical protein
LTRFDIATAALVVCRPSPLQKESLRMTDTSGFRPDLRAAARASPPVENLSFHFTPVESRKGPASRPRLRRSFILSRSGSTPTRSSSATSSSPWLVGARRRSKRSATVAGSPWAFTSTHRTHEARGEPIDNRHPTYAGSACDGHRIRFDDPKAGIDSMGRAARRLGSACSTCEVSIGRLDDTNVTIHAGCCASACLRLRGRRRQRSELR